MSSMSLPRPARSVDAFAVIRMSLRVKLAAQFRLRLIVLTFERLKQACLTAGFQGLQYIF